MLFFFKFTIHVYLACIVRIDFNCYRMYIVICTSIVLNSEECKGITRRNDVHVKEGREYWVSPECPLSGSWTKPYWRHEKSPWNSLGLAFVKCWQECGELEIYVRIYK